jgi:hypothetical protein
MAGRIYVLDGESKLIAMEESAYDSESLLQALLADHPDLLAGEQMNADEPRRWVLVAREMAVPGEPDGAGRWSLDHLFLDQDAVPTLVEVKRSTDTRIRREVVGQMLDYAANAVVHWPVETIKARFEGQCKEDNRVPEAALAILLGEGQDTATFWQQVKTNLQAGRIRLVFIADKIPPELQRVVEFLNSQMDPAEVLAVEVKQFVSPSLKTLVPRVLGQTETSRQRKTVDGAERRQWDETSFLDAIQQRRGEEEAAIARALLEWANRRQLRVWWGQGKQDGSFFPSYVNEIGQHFLFAVWTYGNLEVQFQRMKSPPFSDEEKRKELAQRLSAIKLPIPEDALRRRPSFNLSLLKERAALQAFLGTFDWVLSEIKQLETAVPNLS